MSAPTTQSPHSSIGIDFVPERQPVSVSDPLIDTTEEQSNDAELLIDSLGGWQDFELMPPSYRDRRHATRTLYKWGSVLLILASITIGSSVALWGRGRQTILRNAQLVADAKPIGELRHRAQVLESENALLEKWCRWVDSARPDDCVLQILNSVALATHPDGPMPVEKHLDVQTIDIKLPLEYDLSEPKVPSWAEPGFTLSAVANGRDILLPWNERLEKSGRLRNLKLTAPGGAWREALIQVTALPLSTRMVP